jgi:hypothetical protein
LGIAAVGGVLSSIGLEEAGETLTEVGGTITLIGSGI